MLENFSFKRYAEFNALKRRVGCRQTTIVNDSAAAAADPDCRVSRLCPVGKRVSAIRPAKAFALGLPLATSKP